MNTKMGNKTALEQLENWILVYRSNNGNPPIGEVLRKIDLLKDYEKEQFTTITQKKNTE